MNLLIFFFAFRLINLNFVFEPIMHIVLPSAGIYLLIKDRLNSITAYLLYTVSLIILLTIYVLTVMNPITLLTYISGLITFIGTLTSGFILVGLYNLFSNHRKTKSHVRHEVKSGKSNNSFIITAHNYIKANFIVLLLSLIITTSIFVLNNIALIEKSSSVIQANIDNLPTSVLILPDRDNRFEKTISLKDYRELNYSHNDVLIHFNENLSNGHENRVDDIQIGQFTSIHYTPIEFELHGRLPNDNSHEVVITVYLAYNLGLINSVSFDESKSLLNTSIKFNNILDSEPSSEFNIVGIFNTGYAYTDDIVSRSWKTEYLEMSRIYGPHSLFFFDYYTKNNILKHQGIEVDSDDTVDEATIYRCMEIMYLSNAKIDELNENGYKMINPLKTYMSDYIYLQASFNNYQTISVSSSILAFLLIVLLIVFCFKSTPTKDELLLSKSDDTIMSNKLERVVVRNAICVALLLIIGVLLSFLLFAFMDQLFQLNYSLYGFFAPNRLPSTTEVHFILASIAIVIMSGLLSYILMKVRLRST